MVAAGSALARPAALIVVLGLANAVLYACLLPVWEGFDEPFHYGYVQWLSAGHQFPVVNRTPVSREIRESLKLLPVSWLLHNALPDSSSFEEWFHLSGAERADRLTKVGALPPVIQREPSDLLNYEAQQAPIAYALLAPVNAAVSHIDLRTRILLLRLVVALVATVFLLFAANLLLDALAVTGLFRAAALVCLFEMQMLWASIAHIGNDSLAIPLSVLFLALLASGARENRPKVVLGTAAVLAAGLLTKAYFLAFVPVFAVFLIVRFSRRRLNRHVALLAAAIVLIVPAGWYARNLVLYGSLSGTQESIAGVTLPRAAAAFFQIDWLSGTIALFRWALWTGNWSFVSFSRVTIDLELILLTAAFVLFFARARRITAGEWWVAGACLSFFLGLIYQTCVTWVATNGESRHAEPWYMQGILPCLWALTFLSFERSGITGRFLAAAMVVVSAWIAAATYLFKLIPLYGGFSGRATIAATLAWWRHFPAETLSQTIAAPLILLFAALAVFLLSLGIVNFRLLCAFVVRPSSGVVLSQSAGTENPPAE